MRGMPKDATTDNMADRFLKLQKMMKKVKNLDQEVIWDKKPYVPVYRRNKNKTLTKTMIEDLDSIEV